jgi:hypothetical protein
LREGPKSGSGSSAFSLPLQVGSSSSSSSKQQQQQAAAASSRQ